MYGSKGSPYDSDDSGPIEVRLRPDRFYSSSVGEEDQLQNTQPATSEDDESLGYTVVACNLANEQNPKRTIGRITPLPLPILVSKIPDVKVGDTHLFVTHNDGRTLCYQVGIVVEVYPHHCVYEHARSDSILSSGGPAFDVNGNFIGIQHQCGENSFCVFIRSLVIHLFDSATLGPCRISLWGDEEDASRDLDKGVHARYHGTYNTNNNSAFGTSAAPHPQSTGRLPSAATTYGGLPAPLPTPPSTRQLQHHPISSSISNNNLSNGSNMGALVGRTNSNHLNSEKNSRAASVLQLRPTTGGDGRSDQDYHRSIYDPTEAAEHAAKPKWIARQRLRDVGSYGSQLVDYSEFERFSEWEAARERMPETLKPRTVREVWTEWYTDYQSLVLLLHAFPYNERMVELVLSELTSHTNRMNIPSVAGLGGIGIMLQTLDLHPFSEKLMLTGVTALARLSLTNDNKNAIIRCDGVAVITAIMFEYPSNFEIQQWATYALLNLTQETLLASENVRSLVKLQGVEKIIHNMRIFPNAKHLQRWSAMCLTNILKGGGDDGTAASRNQSSSQPFASATTTDDASNGAVGAGIVTEVPSIPQYLLEAWSICLSPVTVSEERGPRADTPMDATSSKVLRGGIVGIMSNAGDNSNNNTTPISIELLPLLWRLLYVHKEDGFVMLGLSQLFHQLLCCVPPAVVEKVRLRNSTIAKRLTSPTSRSVAAHFSNSVREEHQKESSKSPVYFYLPITFYTDQSCLLNANRIFYPNFLAMAVAERYAHDEDQGYPLGLEKEIKLRNMPEVPALPMNVLKHAVRCASSVTSSVSSTSLTIHVADPKEQERGASPSSPELTTNSRSLANGDEFDDLLRKLLHGHKGSLPNLMTSSQARSGGSSPTYFTNFFDVLLELIAVHGLGHALAGRRNAEEELQYKEEVIRLITGNEKNNISTAGNVVDDASSLASVQWGVHDARGRLTRLILGQYDLFKNVQNYRSGRRTDGKVNVEDAGSASGDAADVAKAELLTNLCSCLEAVLLEADRTGTLKGPATPQYSSASSMASLTKPGSSAVRGTTTNTTNTQAAYVDKDPLVPALSPFEIVVEDTTDEAKNTSSTNGVGAAGSLPFSANPPSPVAIQPMALASYALSLKLPELLLEVSYYHVSEVALHAKVKSILRLVGKEELCNPTLYPFLYHASRGDLAGEVIYA